MRPRPLFPGLTLVVPLLSGCFLFAPPAPTGPTPEQIAAEQAAREEERQRQIEEARTEFIASADAAKAAFEAEQTIEKLIAYADVLGSYVRLETDAREGIDLNAYYDVIMTGSTAMLEPRVAEWAKKKNRTPELKAEIKSLHGFRVSILDSREAPASEHVVDGTAMLALGPLEQDWKIGDGPGKVDYNLVSALGSPEDRPAYLEVCKNALGLAIADDKKDVTRQHYIMEVCLRHGSIVAESDWEEELRGWATAKQASKQVESFARGYRPIWAEMETELAAAQARLDAEEAQRWEEFDRRQAEVDAQIAAAQGGGSSSGGSSSGGGGGASPAPVSLTIRNSCTSSGVKFFWGDDPKFGSGRTDSLGSNSRTSASAKVGQVIWLTDDNQNGISSVTVGPSTREIEFTCGGISAR